MRVEELDPHLTQGIRKLQCDVLNDQEHRHTLLLRLRQSKAMLPTVARVIGCRTTADVGRLPMTLLQLYTGRSLPALTRNLHRFQDYPDPINAVHAVSNEVRVIFGVCFPILVILVSTREPALG